MFGVWCSIPLLSRPLFGKALVSSRESSESTEKTLLFLPSVQPNTEQNTDFLHLEVAFSLAGCCFQNTRERVPLKLVATPSTTVTLGETFAK